MANDIRWSDQTIRFPEDQLLRASAFRIKARPSSGEAIWIHVSGTMHTHKDAVEIVLRKFGYVSLKATGWWRHEASGVRHTIEEAATMIRMKLRDYQNS